MIMYVRIFLVQVLTDHRCNGHAKPAITTSCNTQQCPGKWKTGRWGEVSLDAPFSNT